ncbi:MAG: SAM-dependent methyltransferase [Nanoarchaeota archaeon]
MNKPNLERMVDFVASRGGTVRFDEYMGEHILGEGGFYSQKVNIGVDGHFVTYADRPPFIWLVYIILKHEGLLNKQFLEIGGGSGKFKEFFRQFSSVTEYISVEASPRLALAQSRFGGITHVGKAENLPLKDNSLEGVIFGNELLDELPCRVFMISNSRGELSINQEGYVRADNGQLVFGYSKAQRDDFLELYESFLRGSRPDVPSQSIISVSPGMPVAISEMGRVLKKGKILLIDYGYWNAHDQDKPRDEQPFFIRNGTQYFVDSVLQKPYETDLTHSVDFEFARWHAARTGLFSTINVMYVEDFAKRMLAKKLTPGDIRQLASRNILLEAFQTYFSSSVGVLEMEKR